MHKLVSTLATLVALLALAACSPAALFTMEGEYDLLLEITESTNPTFPVGYTDTANATATTSGDDVSMDIGVSELLTGTRSGNSVTLGATISGDTIVMNLTWSSDDEFEGTGRIDYADTTHVEFHADGQTATSLVTSLGAAGLFGVGR